MESKEENGMRVEALCKSLGHLWSENDVVEVFIKVPPQKRDECKRTLFGKLYSKSNVNYPAFLSTIKKAWKTEAVTCSQKEPGLFTFVFQSKDEKERVMKIAPWSFANNLLVLKQCESEIPEHCYDFTRSTFWVRIGGIPPSWRVETVFNDLGRKLGPVLDI
ncbi:hypothetical protein ACJRO7_029753 [Eucalyptus globulus]|uniref:DUF4283 domain-containing protein n=1 Tax=Eucalyptus globulus TaxID=34317 RepID=A0ABD3JCY8_EUCGL